MLSDTAKFDLPSRIEVINTHCGTDEFIRARVRALGRIGNQRATCSTWESRVIVRQKILVLDAKVSLNDPYRGDNETDESRVKKEMETETKLHY